MIVFGVNPVYEVLKNDPDMILRLIIDKGRKKKNFQEIMELAHHSKVPCSFEPVASLDRMADGASHQGIVAQLSEFDYAELSEILERNPSRIVLLDGVEDPRNLGAVIRTAEASGTDAVIIPSRNSCGVNGTVMKTSAGAAFHLPVCRIGNSVRTILKLKEEGFWIIGLDMEGEESLASDLVERKLLLVVGGEHRGLRPLVRKHCDFLHRLPMRGRVSSLNLSVAAGILLYSLLPPIE
jgi:23S rRNA (guanosine2251-2'-O)-methyltransferase